MKLLAFLSLALLSSGVFAFPSLLSLDGFLTNSSGSALDGSFSFVFSLYNVSSGGSALWSESQTLAVSSGKLNALLGSVSALNLPFDQDYYLGINVNADGEMSPRYRIASSAYSYTARTLAAGANAIAGIRFANDSSACDSLSAGTLRWSGTRFQFCDGSFWKSFAFGLGDATTGGAITTVGGYRIHTFLSNGTFTPDTPGTVDVLVVAGGGGGGVRNYNCAGGGGGGGAGGLVYQSARVVAAVSYPVTVGNGGAGSLTGAGSAGGASVFDAITALGGGGGGAYASNGNAGGSGGGAGRDGTLAGGSATQGASGGGSGFGNAGGGSTGFGGGNGAGGGGGAGGAGGANVGANGGAGGIGKQYSISGTAAYYAGGGGGVANGGTVGAGGAGGGGAGGTDSIAGGAGAANTGGGGGGGGGTCAAGGNGGSGIVIIRYPI